MVELLTSIRELLLIVKELRSSGLKPADKAYVPLRATESNSKIDISERYELDVQRS